MDNPQDCLVTSSQDIINKTCPSTSGHSPTVYQNRNGRKKKIKSGTEQFPWFLIFQKLCRTVLGSNSMKDLLNAITVYTEHVSRDVVASYSRPNRAAKLKTNMISMLGFFHDCYITMKEPFDDAAYLEKMSDLLTMYFDMEVKASRRGKESVKRITSKLISALFIILNNSSVYILDTILKARFTVKSYSEICIPIFKMVTHLPQSQEMNYVRCLLVFKLWKRMLPYREERNSINRLAVAKLSHPPAQVLEFVKRGLLANVLPTPPEDKKSPLVTRFYMTKKFNLRESIKAFLKMEADLKLNDFTSALDSIRFIDDEEDVVSLENTFEKDYSLLESIWIDISNSPESPDHSSLSSPSTSGSSPLDVSISGTSRVLELSKTTPRKVKKSLFKPKSAKKNKQSKNKSKDKTKKKKEDLVIDLCKENEENCSGTTQKASKSLNASSGVTSESQVLENVSPSSTSVDGFATNVKSDSSFFSENIPEVNSSEDLKLSHKLIEKDFVKSNIEVESKLVVKNQVKSEAPFVSKSKHLGSVSKPRVGDILSPLTPVSDFSTNVLLEATVAPQSVPELELNLKESFKFNCKSNEKNQEKAMMDEESNMEHESVSNVFVEPNEIRVVPQESDVMKIQSEKESNLDTASMEGTEEEPAVNKIVISCKNFSKIGFKHEKREENSVKSINEESEELISTIKVSKDPILKTESLKEDSLLFKDAELSSEKLSLDQLEQVLDAEELRWDNTLKDDSPGFNLSTNEGESISKDICSNDFRNARFNLNTEISHSPKPDIVKDFFHEQRTNVNKNEPNKRLGEPVEHVLSQATLTSEDDAINRFGYHMQNYLQESVRSKQVINTKDNKTVVNSENGSQPLDIIVNPVNKPRVETPLASELIPDITGIDLLKSGTKIIHKSISTIIHELKEGESSTSSDNSNQESSEVSSSSFEDSYQMKSSCTSNLKINPLVETQESKSCKVEQKHFKEFSACMQHFENSLVKSQFKEKCDKNTQVPSVKSSFVINKSDFIASSQNSSIPKNDKLNKQAFNLHKGLNTCLLHKILGEEDCLKNGCLLKNSTSEKFPQDLNKGGFPDVSLKQELENSSELPSENSTPTIPSLWNPTAGIKVEKDHENSRSSECIEEIRNTSSEFLVRSVTEACNFKELDYNIGNECDNLTSGYDCESDCEDSNLVIDEDIDSIKDHNETEDIQLQYGTDCLQTDAGNNTVSPVILTNNNKHSKKIDQQIWDNNVPCEILNVAIDHQEQPPGMNNLQTKENESLRNELAGKHKMPRIVESNIKTSSLRSAYVSEGSLDSSLKYRPLGSNEVLFAENSSPYISAQRYGAEISTIVPKHYTQPKIIKRSDASVNIGQISPSCRVFSPYPTPLGKDPNSIRTKNRDPRLGPVSRDNSTYCHRSNVNIQSSIIQPNQINSLESLGSVNQPILTSEIAKAASPRLVPSPSRYETYIQYNMGNTLSVPSNQSSGSPVEQYCQRSPIGNDKYRGLEKLRQKRESPIGNNTSHTNLGTYAEGSNVKDNSNPSFHKYSATEPKKIKAGEPLYDNINSTRDPLCLVKNKEDLRETYDFEFNVFPIAQEVEICSGSENLGGEWLYPVTSEIGHPDWPIANETNVIDSSGYTQTPDQYMYSMLKNDEGSAIAEGDQPSYMPLELQQIDNRHPNMVGKNINKKLNLHLRTLEGDYNLCCSQSEFKEFYLSRDVPPTIPVPFPPQGLADNLNSTLRCPCEQCSDNYQKLLSNYNVLTHFRNSKIKPLGVFSKLDEASFSEKDLNGEFDSSLPLKKRKTLTNSKATDDLVLPSYPNTPMISIAQLELTGYEQGNPVIVPNPQSQWRDSAAYNPLNLVQPPATKAKRRASKRRKSSR